MTARVVVLAAYQSPRSTTPRDVRASVEILADYRARRAEASVVMTMDPLAAWRSWWDFLAGGR